MGPRWNPKTIILVALCAFSLSRLANSASISAIPSVIDVGVTEALVVTCGGLGDLPTMPILVSLTLSASDSGPDGQFVPVAVSSAIAPFQALPGAMDGIVSAHFHPRGASHLQVSWANPGVNVARVYKCEVAGLDARWMPAALSDTIEVSSKVSGRENTMVVPVAAATGNAPAIPSGAINELSDRVRGLVIKMNGMQTMATNFGLQMNKRFAEIEKKINSNVKSIEDIKASLASQGGGNINAPPQSAPVSSTSVRAMQSQLRRLDTSYEQMVQTSTQTALALENVTKALDQVAQEGRQTSRELAEELQELSKRVMSSGSSPASSAVLPSYATSRGFSGGSGDCCQAVSELQAFVQTMGESGQTLTRRVDKLTLWTSAARDADFEVSDIYEGRRYFLLKEASTFELDAAHWNCMRFGGYLLEVDDEAEFNFVLAFIKGYSNINQVYTGANDVDAEKKWVFRYSQRNVSFFNWARGQPDNRRRNEDCIYIKGSDGKMYDGYCEMRGNYSKFVCEVPE